MEEWRDIEGYEGLYQVSNYGRVKSLKHLDELVLKPSKKRNGYLGVVLCENGNTHSFGVHRLVAEVFIPNPQNLPQVNHKDEDKTNNRVENLEWCSSKYNVNYGNRNTICAEIFSKKVYQYTLDNELVKIWQSTQECGRNGFLQSCVSSCCQGKQKTHKGFKWSYVPLKP